MADLLFRHDSFRPSQKQICADAWSALKNSQNLVLSAPTGCGKTDAVLSPAITHALETGLTVFFLTPKISQHEIAASVVRGIAEKYAGEKQIEKLRAVDFVGRRHMCLDESVRESDAFYELCNRKKRKNDCPYHANFTKKGQTTLRGITSPSIDVSKSFGAVATHKELFQECLKHELCPYDAASKIARESNVIIADYYHLISPSVRDVFLSKIGKKVSESIIIVDEAHNVPSRARELLSNTLKQQTLSRAAVEASEIGNSDLESLLLDAAGAYMGLKKKKLKEKNENYVDPEELRQALPEDFGNLATSLADCGMQYLETKNKTRSASLRVAAFLSNWDENAGSESFAQIFDKEKGLSLCCMDSSKATQVLNASQATIAMSGTLTPLEAYRDMMGLDKTRTKLCEHPSPFPRENKLSIIINSVTSRFSERNEKQFLAIAQKLQDTLEAMNYEKTALFFPSYGVMNETLSKMKIPSSALSLQQAAMLPHQTGELMEKFRKNKGVLCAVMGGSLTEGIDFHKSEIKCIAIVGVPIAETNLQTRALAAFYDKQGVNGWEYAVTVPAMNKAVQAAGRGIRKETDKCIVLYLDERYAWPNYAKCLPKSESPRIQNQPWKLFHEFFEN